MSINPDLTSKNTLRISYSDTNFGVAIFFLSEQKNGQTDVAHVCINNIANKKKKVNTFLQEYLHISEKCCNIYICKHKFTFFIFAIEFVIYSQCFS
ncbi:MAG TPA: hypothetical protein DIW44_10555 [Anaerolineaceae bacterium]|nr:hypothetical protein [Anaerolineaceae bacterium]